MTMRILPLLLFFFCIQFKSLALNFPADSTGIEKKDGKIFILHRVEEKETLYSLSRRYNVPINVIIKNNPPTEFGLEVGQILRVPLMKQKVVDNNRVSKGNPTGEVIKHIVAPKETVFSISRKYNVSIADIKQWNHMEDNILKIGQELVIKKHAQPKSEITPISKGKIHVVKPKETLYSISRMYGVEVKKLRELNELNGNEINIGQKLLVERDNSENDQSGVKTAEISSDSVAVAEHESKPENNNQEVDKDDSPDKNSLTEEKVLASTKDVVVDTPMNETREKQPSDTFEEVTEKGVAELIDGSSGTRKYLALHRTAEIGTILRVRNEMNGQEVFVRVLGRLPETGVNQNVLIRISRPAYEQLGAIDPKFRVSVSYIR